MAEAQKHIHLLLLKESLQLKREHMLQKFLEVPVQQSRVLKREELENFINEAIHIQTESLKEVLQCEIQAIYDILDLKLQKKTLNLNAPIPFPLSIAGQSGQDEALKFNKARKEKKAKGKKM
nr:hypothetical protein HJG59_001941 [Molossus molossus]